MKPVMQTTFFDPKLSIDDTKQRGNCWTACIASMLELDIEEVPNFVQIGSEGGENYFDHTLRFLKEHGYQLINISQPDAVALKDVYYIQSGISPRGPDVNGENVYHAVIYQNGKLAHDPHPDNTGILTEEWACLIEKIEPDDIDSLPLDERIRNGL